MKEPARRIIEEISKRLSFMADVGVGYLSLSRRADTLSSGESQRIRLATQIGSKLSGVLYVLDEPTIGLHPRDTSRLLGTLEAIRDLENTVLVVEHDRDTMVRADYIVGNGLGRFSFRALNFGDRFRRRATSGAVTGTVGLDHRRRGRRA